MALIEQVMGRNAGKEGVCVGVCFLVGRACKRGSALKTVVWAKAVVAVEAKSRRGRDERRDKSLGSEDSDNTGRVGQIVQVVIGREVIVDKKK